MSRPLRICMVAACPTPFPRGTPIRVTRFAEALTRLGHEVHLVTYGDGSGPLEPAVHVHRIRRFPGIRVDQPGPTLGKLLLLDPLLALRVREVVREGEFDVIHAHHYEALLVALTATRGKAPIFYDAHTVLESELPAYGSWLRVLPTRTLGRRIDRWLPPKADFTVAASELLRDHLIATGTLAPERVAVVGNGVELRYFPIRVTPVEPEADGGILVYAGNLGPYQGGEHLLEGFRRVLERRPRARLRVLTSSPSASFESSASALGVRDRIEIRSVSLDELSEALAGAHVAINPRPRCDGVPQKNLNYMAAAAPLVAFSQSLHPYRHGVTGVGVEEISGLALGNAVLDLLGRPEERARLGRAARATLEREFTWEKQARRLSEIYERLIGH